MLSIRQFLFTLVFIGMGISNLAAQEITPLRLNGDSIALIIGISNYEKLSPLSFGAKDAVDFGEFLFPNQNSSNLENVKTLLNNDASTGNIWNALAWFRNSAQENDKAFFFFSGHGDVESANIDKRGYLLPYNIGTTNYSNGGIDLKTLDGYFQTMILEGVDVIIIIDACKSRKLAGGAPGAKQLNDELQKSIGNEIKILSSLENEKSYEKNILQSGVFTNYLLEGLKGKADGFGGTIPNQEINLLELDGYLKKEVSEETNGQQIPDVIARDMNFVISYIDEYKLNGYVNDYSGDRNTPQPDNQKIKDTPTTEYQELEVIEESRTNLPHKNISRQPHKKKNLLEPQNLAPSKNGITSDNSINPKFESKKDTYFNLRINEDPFVIREYKLFLNKINWTKFSPKVYQLNIDLIKSVKEGNIFGPPKKGSTFFYFDKIKKAKRADALIPGLNRLINSIIQDSMQMAIHTYIEKGELKLDNGELSQLTQTLIALESTIAGEPILDDLRAKRVFLESFLNDIDFETKVNKLNQAINSTPGSAFLYNRIGSLLEEKNFTNQAVLNYNKALIYASKWEIPKQNLKNLRNSYSKPKIDNSSILALEYKIDKKNLSDSDSDGVADRDDLCPEIKGKAAYFGCPEGKYTNEDIISSLPQSELHESTLQELVMTLHPKYMKSISSASIISAEDRKKLENIVDNIYFEKASDQLSEESLIILDEISILLQKYPQYDLQVLGHSDDSGNPNNDLVLSIKRAFKVKYYLVYEKGIRLSRISSDGYSSVAPIGNNETEDGRTKNHRVELKLIKSESIGIKLKD